MVPSSANSFPLPRYGTAQLFMTDETADPNRLNAYYYAYVQKSTGLAIEPNPENPNDPAIERYGPYIRPAATATVYDMSLILHRKHHFVGNFRPLARCVLAAIQRRVANDPPADPPLLVVYGGCLIDALATYINSNYNQMLQFWGFISETFLRVGQLLQKDFAEYWQKHLELLEFLREEVLQAYEGNSWPNDVWPEFRSWVRGEQIVSSAFPPTCFQVP